MSIEAKSGRHRLTGRHRTVTTDEIRLWRRVMSDVTPIRTVMDKKDQQPESELAQSKKSKAGETISIRTGSGRDEGKSGKRDRSIEGRRYPPVPGAGGRSSEETRRSLEVRQAPGLDRRTAERLRRGKLAIDGRCDLHGYSQDGAYAVLRQFIQGSWQRGHRCVLIITGKGFRQGEPGILRKNLPRWLNEPDLKRKILAFSVARREHGGEGAVYVLIRKRKNGRD